ncbi:Receptor-type tyrosine-protein phosphatase F [Geodia barretti]|uniref:Receptor-type tyrosine-protein phosphatase F n=1 Tax=Geodia barretti TaxID=519541 RepID=A0AA35W676_GEOBA|nr:Receptor-type tyrosine-protein phosphatase F [Geodia barretti]
MDRLSVSTSATIVFLSLIGVLFGQRTCTTTQVSYQTTSSVGYYSEPYSQNYGCGFWDWSRCSRTRYRSRTRAVYRQTAVYRTVCCSGYTGSRCEAVCPFGCANGGTCTRPRVCSCRSGWTGATCSQPVCNPSCENGGTCTSPNTCTCQNGWSGDSCNNAVCPSGCANGGTCTRPRVCSCQSGWTGATCSQPVCTPSCENGGTCTSPNTCTCQNGWSGDSCNNDINECAVDNGGCHHTCHNTAGSFECRCNSGYSLASDGRTCNEPPAVPRNIVVSNVGKRTATVSWVPPPNTFPNQLTAVSAYRICASQNQFQEGNRVVTAGQQSRMYEFTNLEEYTAYFFHVAAFNSFGEGASNDPIEATTLEAAPSAAPLAVQAFPNSSYNITILWSPPPEIDRNGVIIYYEIQLTETENGTEFQWTSPELTTTRGSLHPHFHYEFRVAAHTSIGTGPFSAVETVQTLPAAPTAAPTQLRVSNFDSSTIALVWEPPPFTDRNGDIVRYHIRVTEQETQTIFEYSSTSQHYTLTSLHPYYNYVISIAAETVGVGPFTTGLLQPTMESVPSSAPGNFSMAVVNSTSILLSWSELPLPERNGVVQGYTICLTNVRNGRDTDYSAVSGPYSIVNLHPDFTYRAEVAAVTVVGAGPFSSQIEVRLPEAAPSGPPTHFSVDELSPRSITLKWGYPLEEDRNGVISGFRVRFISNNFTDLEVENATITIEEVKPFTLYYAEVAAFTMVGIGPYTVRIRVLTPEDVPSPVSTTMLEAIQGSPTQLTVQWRPPEEPNGELLAYSVCCRESTQQPLCDCDSAISVSSTSCPCGDLEQDTSYHLQAMFPVGLPHVKVIGGFSPYTNYTCFMTANTSAGESSPGIPHSSTTDESTPADEPQDIMVNSLNSTAILIQWSPPHIPNGIILFYTIYINDSITFNIIAAYQNSFMFGWLSPYQLLNVRLSASTKVGEGPLTESQSVTTDESGTDKVYFDFSTIVIIFTSLTNLMPLQVSCMSHKKSMP